jgi:hypothetical protein
MDIDRIADKIAKQLTALRYEFAKLKNDQNSWYNKPEMAGHSWAKETVIEIERIVNKYGSKQTQQLIIGKVFDFGNDDWHYFNNMGKKYLGNVLFVLKNLDAFGPLKTLMILQRRSGMWREDIEKILHVMAYDADPQKYIQEYGNQYGWMGMAKEEGEARAKKLVDAWRQDAGM